MQAEGVRGTSRVVCFSPFHNLTLPLLKTDSIKKVIDTWCNEYLDLGSKEEINYVQIFENKGSMMGCSNPHPHGQIWATESIPEEPSKEIKSMRNYYEKNGSCLLCDYQKLELEKNNRIVTFNDSFICIVPFWAVWPFETMILARNHKSKLIDLSLKEKQDLAEIIKILTTKYDNLFNISFPYSMGCHQAPTDDLNHDHDCHLHFHFYPPLLRSSTVRKFLVGFEMLGEPQRDLTAEQAADRLKQLANIHYSQLNNSLIN